MHSHVPSLADKYDTLKLLNYSPSTGINLKKSTQFMTLNPTLLRLKLIHWCVNIDEKYQME